jgi:hypothetical protein
MEHNSSENILETKTSKGNNSRKFNTDFRKKLVTKIDKIITSKNKNNMIELYNIINKDIGNNFSSNRNGIFINMNILSDQCIEDINTFIEEKNTISATQSEVEPNYNKYFSTNSTNSFKIDEVELISDIGTKLSNQEKHIIKRIRNKDL